MVNINIESIVAELRIERGDLPHIEVKSAAGGFPESIIPTLSSLSNKPGGGMIILGLDEASNFKPVELRNVRKIKEALASKARQAIKPPLVLEIEECAFEGKQIIVAFVSELDAAQKPAEVISGKFQGVWIRAWDGDYRASQPEIQWLLASRSQPRFDSDLVADATIEDLDSALVDNFVATCHQASSQLSRIKSRDELLWRMGVLVGEGRTPSVAGLLALGVYPQQFLPMASLQAVQITSSGERAQDAQRFDGPIPHMLSDALAWVARTTPTAIKAQTDGTVRDRQQWPLEAVRELLSNALIHRDYSPWGLTESALLRLDEETLVMKNPGGLYGVTLNRLGNVGVSSARNAHLLRICQYVRLPDGSRVVEALASGIPTVLKTLRQAKLPEPIFDDNGLRFTVVLKQPNRSLSHISDLSGTALTIFESIEDTPITVAKISELTGHAPATIRKHLRNLKSKGLVAQTGGKGQITTYRSAMSKNETFS